MTFEVHLQLKNESGKVSLIDNNIVVENSDATTILISAATSYNGYDKSPGREGKEPSIEVQKNINAAAAVPARLHSANRVRVSCS